MTTDVGIPEDIADVVKGAITGLHQLVDAEAVPLEQQYREILTDERRFFSEDGRICDEMLDARKQVRMKAAEAGYYGMFAPESVGGGGIGIRVMVFLEEALYRRYGPGRPLITSRRRARPRPAAGSGEEATGETTDEPDVVDEDVIDLDLDLEALEEVPDVEP